MDERSGDPLVAEPTAGPDAEAAPAPADGDPADGARPTASRRRRTGRPPSVNAVSLILLLTGGAIEGYAIALTAGDPIERQYSLVWAFIGAVLVVTAWALRGRRWWGAAAAIGVSVVGLVAGMFGVYGALVLASVPAEERANWLTTVGLIGVGAASIAIIGLLSSAWPWLTATGSRLTSSGGTPSS